MFHSLLYSPFSHLIEQEGVPVSPVASAIIRPEIPPGLVIEGEMSVDVNRKPGFDGQRQEAERLVRTLGTRRSRPERVRRENVQHCEDERGEGEKGNLIRE